MSQSPFVTPSYPGWCLLFRWVMLNFIDSIYTCIQYLDHCRSSPIQIMARTLKYCRDI